MTGVQTCALPIYHDDMLPFSCCHDKNACVPSNSCMNSNVEETQLAIEQDMNLSSSIYNFSSSSTIFCLMAKSSSSDDNNNDNNVEEDDEDDDDESFHKKGLMVLNALPKKMLMLSSLKLWKP